MQLYFLGSITAKCSCPENVGFRTLARCIKVQETFILSSSSYRNLITSDGGNGCVMDAP